MKNPDYRPRIADKKVEEYLSAFGAICIEGPKWCGKTWTSYHHCNSAVYLADPAGNFQNRQLARLSPETVLSGESPRLIDEWQEVPPIWDAVRFKVDEDPGKGQFILTGSSTPDHKGILHSGAGRIARIRMRPMSLYEMGVSNGKVSLRSLCAGTLEPVMIDSPSLPELIELVIRGGWPGSLGLPFEQATILPGEYINAVIEDDIYHIDNVKRDTAKIRLLLRSLARNESAAVSDRALIDDMKTADGRTIDADTVRSYLDIFSRLFLIENQPPYAAAIRSSVRVKQAEKRHFADPSLACALLRVTPGQLLNDLNTLGFLFEALCERDLRIYAGSFGADLYHYQDYIGREIDAVIGLPDGQWCAFEIKLGADQIDSAAANLLKIKEEIEKDPGGKVPTVLCVICGISNAAYRREDGVFVVPITSLAP